jgi:hypothetical protein
MKTSLLCAAATAALTIATAQASVAELEGTWDNAKPSSGGLAEFDITFDGGAGFVVRGAASCSPRPCDLGSATGYALVPPGRNNVKRDAIGISAGFEGGDATRQVIATVSGKDRLQVVLIQSYRDGRPATFTSETFRRADRRGGGVAAECVSSGNLRIRYDNGEWVLSGSNGPVAAFDTPDEAGFARFALQSQGLSEYCTIEAGGFEYWTKPDGSLPRGSVSGEYCVQLGAISVRQRGRAWQVQSGRETLYEVNDRGVADEIASTLVDTRAGAQCFVGDPGRGLTYFRR